MPTKTFFNLDKEKRIRVLKAAKKEFSRVPLDKAVIANIAKEADIPRGSFYQYFISLEDLYVYLIDYLYGINKKKFEKYLEDNDNDVYAALKYRFANEIDKLSKEENRQFKLNTVAILFSNNNYSQEMINYIMDKQNQFDINYFPANMQENKNIDKFVNVVKALNDMFIQKYIAREVSDNEIKNEYNHYIDFLQLNFGTL